MAHIAFITNNYTPYAAGVVKSIDAIMDQLRKMGHTVLIIAPQFLKKHDDPSYVKRVPALFLFHYRQKHMMIPWRAKQYVTQYLEAFQPDYVHLHHPFFLGSIGLQVARELGIPVVFTYHTVYEDYLHYVPFPPFLIKPIITKNILNFCNQVDTIIAPSSSIKRYLHEQGIDNTVIIPSPLRTQFFEKTVSERQLKKPYRLLCVSRFTKEKNLPVLFELLAKLPDYYYLTLVGYGDQEHELRKAAQRYGSRVCFVINPSSQALLEAYQRAHLFVFSSQTDTQAIVLAESMAAGTPVIALDGPGQRDSIKQGYNGFIVADADEMSDKIQALCMNQALYTKLQSNAAHTALDYRATIIVQKLLTLYSSQSSHK